MKKKMFACLVVFVGIFCPCVAVESYGVLKVDSTRNQQNVLESLSIEDVFNLKIRGISKGEENIREAPMSVSTVGRDELIRDGSHGMIDMAGRAEGFVNLATNNFGSKGPLARGLYDLWRYQLSMDLMPFKDYGHMTFSPYWVENIELVRGPAGMMWGEGAFAGLINMNLRNDLEGFETHLGIGELNKYAADAMYGHKFENPGDGFFVGFHYEQIDDQRIANNTTNKNMIGGDNLFQYGVLPSWAVVGKIQYKPFKCVFFKDNPAHRTVQDFIQKDFVKQFTDTFGMVVSHCPTTAFRGEYHPLKGFFDQYDISLYANYYRKEWYIPRYVLDAQDNFSIGLNADLKFLDDKLKVIAGGDLFSQEKGFDPRFDMKEPVIDTSKVHSSLDSLAFYRNYFNSYVGTMAGQYPQTVNKRNVFLQCTYKPVDFLGMTLGERLDYAKNGVPEEIVLSGPRAAIFVNPMSDLTLKLLYNQGFRRPTANESKNSMIGIPNPDPEHINDMEFVTMYSWNNQVVADLSLYRQEMFDRIVIFNSTTTRPVYANNTGGVLSYGAEFGLKYSPNTFVNAYVNGQFCNATVFDALDPVTKVPLAKFLSDNRIIYMPKASGLIGAEGDIYHYARINIAERFAYKIPYIGIHGEDCDVNAYYTDFSVRSLKFFERYSIDLNITNLFNQKRGMPAFAEFYSDARGTVEPEGRRMWITFNANLW